MTGSGEKILAVFAHPDDESFGAGGTLALYAGRGHPVTLLCATRGEAGTVDSTYLGGYGSVAELREAELRCATQELGLSAVHILGYRDSGMPGTPANHHPEALVSHSITEVASRIVGFIRRERPTIVITFDPQGGYRHPDHIHVHQATKLAFEKAADRDFSPESGKPYQPRALYYHVFPHGVLRWLTRAMPLVGMDPRRWGRNKDIDLKSLVELEFPIHVRIDTSAVARRKADASACHASQGGIQMRHGLMGVLTRLMGRYESFMQAYPPVEDHHRPRQDLFELV